jgi:hypothetical protein
MRIFIDIIKGVTLTESEAPIVETEADVEAPVVETRQARLQSYLDEVKSLHEGLNAANISGIDVHEFIKGYVACILWSSTDNNDVQLEENYSADDFSPEAHDRIEADCRSFLHQAGPFLTADRYKGQKLGTLESHAGHDFWLTRVGHGSGFWDGDWVGEEPGLDGPLTKAARSFGNLDPYVGDDGKIHLM